MAGDVDARLLDNVREFISEYPEATLMDVMAEHDLTDTEAEAVLAEIGRLIRAGIIDDERSGGDGA